MLQDELVILIHILEAADAALVLANLVGSIKTSADICTEIIAWVQFLVADILLAWFVTTWMIDLTLARGCE